MRQSLSHPFTQGLEYVNDAFAKMYGYASKEEVMGIHPVNLYESKSDRDTLLSHIEKFGRVTNMLLKYRPKRWFHLLGTAEQQPSTRGGGKFFW